MDNLPVYVIVRFKGVIIGKAFAEKFRELPLSRGAELSSNEIVSIDKLSKALKKICQV